MPCDNSLLERGAVCVALYPYSTGFPLDRVVREVEDEFAARLEHHESVDSIAREIRAGDPPEIVVTAKLRRVLLVQTGTDAGRQDILVARIVSITEKRKAAGPNWYRKLQSGIHPAHLLIGQRPEHGTRSQEAYVDLMHLSPIQKAAILRREGALDDAEMREVTDRLMRTLELDISHHVEAAAARLLRSDPPAADV